MPLINFFFFSLGLIVASATTAEMSKNKGFTNSDEQFLADDSATTTTKPSFTTNNMTMTTRGTAMSFSTSTMNLTYSTFIPTTPKQEGDGNSDVGQKTTAEILLTGLPPTDPQRTTSTDVTVKPEDKSDGNSEVGLQTTTEIFTTELPPTDPQRTTATDVKVKPDDKNPTQEPQSSNDSTGIIILVLIIVIAFGLGIACYITKRKGRRYSADFSSRVDEANIPLGSLEPNFTEDMVSANGLQSFKNADEVTNQAQDPEAKTEVEDEQNAVADTTAVDPSTESPPPAPDPVNSEDKPKEDAAEQSPPPPAEPSVDKKSDDEDTISNSTSVELLKETNENNSNNAYIIEQRDFSSSYPFWDIPLDWPV